MTGKWLTVLGASGALALGIAACGDDSSDSGGDSAGGGSLNGTIRIDGSSTVAPLSEAVAELFQGENPGVKVTVGTSGTGGGFEKFCVGETDISDASRQIESDEVKACEGEGIKFEEVQVANDALTVVANPNNPIECLTVDDLANIWGPKSTVSSWSDVGDGSFTADLALYSPGTDSGTFDYFTEAINGEEGVQRTDGVSDVGEDDNATVTGVSGAEGGLGYFGFSFFQENEGSLKAIAVDGGSGCVAPSVETAQDGSYAPLSRGLYIYPSAAALEKPEVEAFVDFYLENINSVAEQVGFIGLTGAQLTQQQKKVAALKG